MKEQNVIANPENDGIIKSENTKALTVSASSVIIPNEKIRAEIINEAINSETPFYDEDLRIAYKERNILQKEGCFDVMLHGTPMYTEYEKRYILDNETLYYIISGRRDWKTQNIRLISCNTGRADENGDCVAQYLADHLGVNIYAPIDIVYINEGRLNVGEREQLSEKDGFKWFYPRKGG